MFKVPGCWYHYQCTSTLCHCHCFSPSLSVDITLGVRAVSATQKVRRRLNSCVTLRKARDRVESESSNSFRCPAMNLARLSESLGRSGPASTGSPYGGRPKYVKFAPGDHGDHLPPVFFEGQRDFFTLVDKGLNVILKDPRTFNPTPGPQGQIHAWGVYPVRNFVTYNQYWVDRFLV
jgi:hypothetical protein